MSTVLKYMDDSQLYNDKATLLKIEVLEDGSKALILDKTIFYPKGGGQPHDKGNIQVGDSIFKVEKVFYQNQEVYHVVSSSFSVKEGSDVILNVDKDTRILHSKLHTLTHLVDDAMFVLGYNFNPLSGCSYTESTYVEYEGTLQGIINKDELKALLEEKINNFINEGFEVKTVYATKEELPNLCYKIPSAVENIDKKLRVVTTYGNKGIPCGGTHVKNIKELKKAVIKKISDKKGIVRVSCSLA